METGEAIQWLLRIGVTSAAFAFLLAQVLMITGSHEDPAHLELALYQERLVHGPMGIVDGGQVVLSRFTERHLLAAHTQAIPTQTQDDPRLGARFTLYRHYDDIDAERPLAIGGLPLRVVHEHRVVDSYLALAAAGLQGPGGGLYERHVLPVLVEGELAFLEMEAVRRT